MEIVTKKRRVDPTLLHKWVYKKSGKRYKKSRLAKVSVFAPKVKVKKSRLIESTLSPISVLTTTPHLGLCRSDNDPAPESLPADSKE